MPVRSQLSWFGSQGDQQTGPGGHKAQSGERKVTLCQGKPANCQDPRALWGRRAGKQGVRGDELTSLMELTFLGGPAQHPRAGGQDKFHRNQLLLKCDSQASSLSKTWELVRNGNPRFPPQVYTRSSEAEAQKSNAS